MDINLLSYCATILLSSIYILILQYFYELCTVLCCWIWHLLFHSRIYAYKFIF